MVYLEIGKKLTYDGFFWREIEIARETKRETETETEEETEISGEHDNISENLRVLYLFL